MRNVLVTGASRGLGLAIAVRLAASGWRVIAISRSQGDPLTEATEGARASGIGEIVFEEELFDLAEVAEVPALIRSH